MITQDQVFINSSIWNTFTEEQTNEYIDLVFSYYRQQGFPYYPTDTDSRLKEFKKLLNYDSNNIITYEENKLCYKQVMHGLSLAWSYFPHSWSIPCNNFRTPMQAFEDDTIFRKVIQKRLKTGTYMSDSGIRKMLKIYSGNQCVSNFRPTTAEAIYNKYATNGTVWDMSSGFGGRLLGFIVSNAKKYIGTEPSTKTYNGLNELSHDYKEIYPKCSSVDLFFNQIYKPSKEIEIYKIGSEDYIPDKESLDFCFTSPPYFDTEKYSDERTQSYKKYPDIDIWTECFLKKTFENCYRGLKQGKYMMINIANTKSYRDLEKRTVKTAIEVGFKLIDTQYYLLSSISHKTKFKYEPIFVFIK